MTFAWSISRDIGKITVTWRKAILGNAHTKNEYKKSWRKTRFAWVTKEGAQYLSVFGQNQQIPSTNSRNISLTIGIPHQGTVPLQWALNFRMLQLPERTKMITLSGQPVDQARNMIVEQAEGDWLWFLDSDVICPHDTFPRLLNTATKNNLKIVSGLYWRRDTNPVPGMYKWFPEQITQYGRGGHRAIMSFKPGDLVDADAIGAGCMLVNMEVFRTIPQSAVRDWYIENYGDTPMSRNIPDGWFYFGTIKGNQMSEDFIFQKTAQKYGFRTIVDTNVLCKHILPYSVGINGFQAVDSA